MSRLLKLHRLLPPVAKSVDRRDGPAPCLACRRAGLPRPSLCPNCSPPMSTVVADTVHRPALRELSRRSSRGDKRQPGLPRAQQVVEQAVAFGASALKYEVYPYSDREVTTMRCLEALAIHADRWSLPIMAEVVPGGFEQVAVHTAFNLRLSVRRAAEAGADLAKIPPPSEGELSEVAEFASIPLLLLGGASRRS